METSRVCVCVCVCVEHVPQQTDVHTMGERVYRAIVNGVMERGEGGFLFLKDDRYAYMFPHEMPTGNNHVRIVLEKQLADETARSIFYVLEERDGTARLAAYERSTVYAAVRDEFEAALATKADEATNGDEQPRVVEDDGGAHNPAVDP